MIRSGGSLFVRVDLDNNVLWVFLLDEAEEDEADDDDDGDDDTPDQTLVPRPLPSHLLLKLVIRILDIFGSPLQLLVHFVQLVPLQIGLLFDVGSERVDVAHDFGNHADGLVPVLNQVSHLMSLRLLADTTHSHGHNVRQNESTYALTVDWQPDAVPTA